MHSWVAPDFHCQVVVRNSFLEVVDCDGSMLDHLADRTARRRCHSGPPTVKPKEAYAQGTKDVNIATEYDSAGDDKSTRYWPSEDTEDKTTTHVPSEDYEVMQPSAKDNGTLSPWQSDDEEVSTVWSASGIVTQLSHTCETGVGLTPEDEDACIMPRLLRDGLPPNDKDACVTPGLPHDGVGQRRKSKRLCKMKRQRIKKLAAQIAASGTALQDANLPEELRANAFIMRKLESRLEQTDSTNPTSKSNAATSYQAAANSTNMAS